MFRSLVNEARLAFILETDSPLCIKSGTENGFDPTLPDIQCIRTSKNGRPAVFIPGSSIKGVIRSRCEKIINLLGGNACNIVERGANCREKFDNVEESTNNKELTAAGGANIYKRMCPACRMFGSTSIGARVKFKDAFPVGQPVMGIRTGVGINRITGAAHKGALYDFEVVEEGRFKAEVTLVNYELYQLKLLMFALKDVDAGYAAFGGASTRGNGKMKISEMELAVRDYRTWLPERLTGYDSKDAGGRLLYKKELYYCSAAVNGMDGICELLDSIDVEKALRGGLNE